MRRLWRGGVSPAAVVLAGALLSGTSWAQPQNAQSAETLRAETLPPREVQRLFDAYVLMQAQERLGISDAQYPQFVQRLKALLDTRRRTLAARNAVIQELARGTSEQAGALALDDAGISERLERLRTVDEEGAADVRKAYAAIDQVLDLRQRARFRVFEEQMERRKVELLTRARQAARASRNGALKDPQ